MKYCLICFHDVYHKTSLIDYFKKEDLICGECMSKFDRCYQSYTIDTLLLDSIYMYNDFLESLLFQFKEGRDIALKDVFLNGLNAKFTKKYFDYTIVFMPSSKQKSKERGFFALEELFAQIKLPKLMLFEKSKDIKQSTQVFRKRKDIKKYIILRKDVELPNTKILLVDDVCTSGSTLKSAYDLISHHTYEVRALVIGVHPSFAKSSK